MHRVRERVEWERQRSTFEALVMAINRSGEVLAAIASCGDQEEALEALMALLKVDQAAATAVLDTQWSVMTRARRDQIVAARDEARDQLR